MSHSEALTDKNIPHTPANDITLNNNLPYFFFSANENAVITPKIIKLEIIELPP